MYDRGKDLNWKNIKDFDVIGSMGKAGGGRNEVSSGSVKQMRGARYDGNDY